MFKNILTVGSIAGAAIAGTTLSTNNDQETTSMPSESPVHASETSVSISDLNFLIDPGTGYLRVMGIIHNHSDQWVMAECHITSYDAAGNPIDVDGWLAEYEKEIHPTGDDAAASVEAEYTPAIPPHGKVCLNHLRDGKKLKAIPANVKVKVVDVMETGEGVRFSNPDFNFVPYIETNKLYDGSTKTYDKGYVIKGSVTNISKKTSKASRLAIVWYNKAGKIVEIEENALYYGIDADKNINEPGTYLLTSHKAGDILTGENRAFGGLVKWPRPMEATKDFGKFELLAYDIDWVD